MLRIAAFALCGVLFAACQQFESPTDPAGGDALVQTVNAGTGHRVTGHADVQSVPFDFVVVDQYSFSAIQHADGRVSGQFEFRAKRTGFTPEAAVTVRAHGVVECVSVTGNKARMGGRVTHTNFPEGIPEGHGLTWSVTDAGSPGRGRDTASELLGAPPQAFCATGAPFTYPEFPLRRGNVQVH